MYRKNLMQETSIVINESIEGETIETKVERIVNNGEPISDGAPLIFTERGDGVVAGYDIRTDRWEVAIDAMDVVAKTTKAKSQAKYEERKAEMDKLNGKTEVKKDGGTESTQGTNS